MCSPLTRGGRHAWNHDSPRPCDENAKKVAEALALISLSEKGTATTAFIKTGTHAGLFE